MEKLNKLNDMKAKEKALELINKFKPHSENLSNGFLVANEDTKLESAKKCAIICVNEVIKQLIPYKENLTLQYFNQVKTEIEKYEK